MMNTIESMAITIVLNKLREATTALQMINMVPLQATTTRSPELTSIRAQLHAAFDALGIPGPVPPPKKRAPAKKSPAKNTSRALYRS